MTLIRNTELCPRTFLGVWRNSPTPAEHDPCPPAVRLSMRNMCSSRQKETMAVYSLLNAMTGGKGWEIGHEPSGRPFVVGQPHTYIGISHTKGFASIIMSTEQAVAVDIEYRSPRVLGIAHRFLRDDEKAECEAYNACDSAGGTIARQDLLLVIWCAKETMYKYYSDKALTFQNIRVAMPPNAPEANACGHVEATNILNGERKTIHYMINEEYVLTYLH